MPPNNYSIFILCLIFFNIKWSILAQDCNNNTQQLCLSYISNSGIDIKHIDDDIPSWNETEDMLRSRCSSFELFTRCMSGEVDYCPSKEHATYSGWIDAYDYLCQKSNLTLVADHLQCFISTPVLVEAQDLCQKVFKVKVDIILNGSSSIPRNKMVDYCKIANVFFQCLNSTLTKNCGKGAAEWQWTWDQKLSKYLLESCTADETDTRMPSAWSISLIVVLVLITVIMVLAIVFLIAFLFRKRKERTRIQQIRRRMQNAASPPPYSAVMYSNSGPGTEPQAHLVDSNMAIRPDDLGHQGSNARSPNEIILPPPYMGEQTPAPEYDSIQETNKTEGEENKAVELESEPSDNKNENETQQSSI